MRLLLIEDDAMIGRAVRQGLGDAMRAVAQRHGAAVTLENASGGGLLVSCLLAPP